MAAVVLSMVLAYVWEGQFQGYTKQKMQRTARAMAESLSNAYSTETGWSGVSFDYLDSFVGADDDLGIRVIDRRGRVLYENDNDLPDPTSGGVDVGAIDMVSSEIYDVNSNKVGSVRLWAHGSESLLSEIDENFRTDSYRAIIWAAFVAVLIASIIGYVSARRLVRPITRITRTAAQIRNGDLTARSGVSGDDEIGRLGETFDEMATSLERDIMHERRLTGDVAHELRTPLMAIQSTVEAIQDGVLPADEERLQTIDDEVRRLSRLVDAMLHLSRLENGSAKFSFEHADVVYLVRSLVAMQEPLFAEHGLRLRFHDTCPHHELYADVDPDGLREAVTNLISNAMRYTPEGGWVLVTVSTERNDVLISVQDTGIGIAKEDIPRTFSRFWRSDASRERAAGGLGVGLAITKGIVDRHNGTIHVESELGHGTTFTIRIPIDQTRHGRKQTHEESETA
jgi:signal transduction histidine kinase